MVFSAPVDDLEFQGKAFLKRIVAVSGDVIELRGEDREFVTINGRVLPDRGPLFHMGLDGKDKEEGKKKSEGTGTSKDKPETVTVSKTKIDCMTGWLSSVAFRHCAREECGLFISIRTGIYTLK